MKEMKIKELIEFLSKLDGEKVFMFDSGYDMFEFYELEVLDELDDAVVVACKE